MPVKDKVPTGRATPKPPQALRELPECYMKDRKDTVVAATSSTLNDNPDRRDASTGNVSQRSTQLGLKTSRSGFPIAQADVLARATERAGSAFRRITAAAKSKPGPIA